MLVALLSHLTHAGTTSFLRRVPRVSRRTCPLATMATRFCDLVGHHSAAIVVDRHAKPGPSRGVG